jgi:uncharacterized membrane protein YeiH
MTACFGGVIRDILCAEIPVILGKKYMLLSVSLEALSFILKKFNLEDSFLYITTTLVIISIRLMAVKFKWYLPTSKTNKKVTFRGLKLKSEKLFRPTISGK